MQCCGISEEVNSSLFAGAISSINSAIIVGALIFTAHLLSLLTQLQFVLKRPLFSPLCRRATMPSLSDSSSCQRALIVISSE